MKGLARSLVRSTKVSASTESPRRESLVTVKPSVMVFPMATVGGSAGGTALESVRPVMRRLSGRGGVPGDSQASLRSSHLASSRVVVTERICRGTFPRLVISACTVREVTSPSRMKSRSSARALTAARKEAAAAVSRTGKSRLTRRSLKAPVESVARTVRYSCGRAKAWARESPAPCAVRA